MACLPALIKNCLAALALLALAAAPATAATFSMKRGINLDIWTTWPEEKAWADENTLLPYPEWRKSLDAADLDELKAAGLDYIRMPVDPAPLLSSVSAPLRDRLLDSVLQSARMINAAGLKVVVDLHLFPTGDSRSVGMGKVMDDPAAFDAYVALVRDVARTLSREDPEKVALELMNEPVTGCQGAEQRAWEDRLLRLFAAARASATRLTLVLSGACWGTSEGLAVLDPKLIPDDNVIWSFHSYAPFLLTHQGATWAGDFIPHVTGLPYPLDSVPRAELDAIVETIRQRIRRDAPLMRRAGLLSYLDEQVAAVDTADELAAAMDAPFAEVATWAAAHGVAAGDIMLGEFGMIRQEYGNDYVMPAATRAAYYRDMIALAERHGFAWSMWDYGGAFGVVDEFDGRRAEPDVMEMIRALK